MSIRDIIEHSVNKNPLAMKEALEEEMRNRIANAIQAKMTEGSLEQEDLDEEHDEDVLSEMSDDNDDDDDDDDMDDDDDDEDDDMDEAACVREMKKLHAAACPKNEMYKKCNEKYGCTKEKFNGLYASYCSK
jgi:phosphopantothenoylcysteine synthetase/decarboxylase